MTKKNSRYIFCLIMTIAMLFSGMCTKQVNADSPFSYSIDNSLVSSILDNADDLTGYPEFLTEESSPSRVLSNIARSKHENNSCTELCIPAANTICNLCSAYSFVADIQSKTAMDSSAALIYFIQQKDGKK